MARQPEIITAGKIRERAIAKAHARAIDLLERFRLSHGGPTYRRAQKNPSSVLLKFVLIRAIRVKQSGEGLDTNFHEFALIIGIKQPTERDALDWKWKFVLIRAIRVNNPGKWA